QGRFASEPVGGESARQGADDSAVEGCGERDTMHPSAEVPERLDPLLGARNDDGVESEKETSQGRSDRPIENPPTHDGDPFIISSSQTCGRLRSTHEPSRGQCYRGHASVAMRRIAWSDSLQPSSERLLKTEPIGPKSS